MMNIFVQLSEFIDATRPAGAKSPLNPLDVISRMRAHFESMQKEFDEDRVRRALAAFLLRGDPERTPRYWSDKAFGEGREIAAFVDFVNSVVVTEANVERSFARSGRLITPLRSRMNDEVAEALVFIASSASVSAAITGEKRPRKHAAEMPRAEWEKLLDTLSKRVPPAQAVHEDVEESDGLGLWAIVRVFYKEGRNNVAYTGMISHDCGVDADGLRLFRIQFQNDDEDIPFDPDGDDGDTWELVRAAPNVPDDGTPAKKKRKT